MTHGSLADQIGVDYLCGAQPHLRVVIVVEHLTKRFGARLAVDDLSFRVDVGEVVGFLGPNGAGKSTTLRMLTGYLAPSEGSIRVANVDALATPVAARRHVGYMPEACPLYPEMRVGEYLRYRAELKGVSRRALKGRVGAALEQAMVRDAEDRIIGQLSKGYRQRVGLADALVADPPLLVLDEPTAGLDPNQIRQVRELIAELSRQKTVLLSTHILPEVEAVCDRVLIIHRGKLIREGTPAVLRTAIAGHQVLRMVGRGTPAAFRQACESVDGVRVLSIEPHEHGGRAIPRPPAEGPLGESAADDVAAGAAADQTGPGREAPARLRIRVETPPVADAAERVFSAVAAAGLTLAELVRESASLEDVFAELTTDEDRPSAEPGPRDPTGPPDPKSAAGEPQDDPPEPA